MPRLWLYGNSGADLGPQELAWTNFYQGAAERDRAAAMDAARINTELALRQQQEDEQAMARDQAARINMWRYRVGDESAGQNLAESRRQFNVLHSPEAQAYNEAMRFADVLPPEQLRAQFGAAGSRLNPLLAYATERQNQTRTATQQADAANEQKKLETIFKNVAEGRTGGTASEIASVFGVSPDKASVVIAQANKERAEKAADALNRATAQARLKAEQTYMKDPTSRATPELTPTEIGIIRNLVPGVPPTVRYSHADGKWTTAPEPLPSLNAYQEYRPGSLNAVPPMPVPQATPRTPVSTLARWSAAAGGTGAGYGLTEPPPQPATPDLSRFGLPDDLVPVFNPSGVPVKIRRSQLESALARGYRLR